MADHHPVWGGESYDVSNPGDTQPGSPSTPPDAPVAAAGDYPRDPAGAGTAAAGGTPADAQGQPGPAPGPGLDGRGRSGERGLVAYGSGCWPPASSSFR